MASLLFIFLFLKTCFECPLMLVSPWTVNQAQIFLQKTFLKRKVEKEAMLITASLHVTRCTLFSFQIVSKREDGPLIIWTMSEGK